MSAADNIVDGFDLDVSNLFWLIRQITLHQ